MAELRLTGNGGTGLLEIFLSFQTFLVTKIRCIRKIQLGRVTARMLKLVPGRDRDDTNGSLRLSGLCDQSVCQV